MIQAICWTLIHSLWQGLLFAMATGLVMLFTRKTSAAARYNTICGLFFLFLIVCAGTFVYEWSVSGKVVDEGDTRSGAVTGGWMAEWITALGRYCSDHALLIVWVWLFVFSVKSLRMMGSLLYTQRIRHYGISDAPADWQKKVDELSRQLGIGRAVKLVESRIVKMPLVTGHWRPMIFMPLGLLTGLPPGEIEAVLLHELAHIRRNDWLINLLQHIAGNLLFFNPGFLWMSALLREERENCCDDIAIDRTRDRVQFVRALINFKEHDLRMTRLANTFPAGKNQLLKRVTRIAHNTNKTLDPAEKVFLVVSCILVSLLVVSTSLHAPAYQAQMVQLPKGTYRISLASGLSSEVSSSPERHSLPPVKISKVKVEGRRRVETQRQRMEIDAQLINDKEQADRDVRQVIKNKQQADLDARQAVLDREQVIRDKQQAERDALQAIRDKQQADRAAHQAELDKRQAILDRLQAEKDAANVNLKK